MNAETRPDLPSPHSGNMRNRFSSLDLARRMNRRKFFFWSGIALVLGCTAENTSEHRETVLTFIAIPETVTTMMDGEKIDGVTIETPAYVVTTNLKWLGKQEASSASHLNLHDVLSLAQKETPLSFSGEVVIVDGAPLCRNGKQVLLLRSLESTE